MSGVNLGALDSSDMFDVVHFMFEEDVLSSRSKEELDVKDNLRGTLYRDFYEREYKYATDGTGISNIGAPLDEDFEDDADVPPVPIDPAGENARAIKPRSFIPATRVDERSKLPFGTGIDPPLG